MDRVQLHQLLREAVGVAAAINIGCFTLYQSQKIYELLYSGRVGQIAFHLVGGHIGKVGASHFGKQPFLITVQVTDKIRKTQRERVPLVGRL